MTLDLERLAGRIGAYRWIELALFEHLGRRATGPGDERERVRYGALAHQHAWHAALWADRYPAIPGADLERSTAPTPGMAALIDAIDTADGAPAAVFRVVVPRLLEAYDRHLASIDADTDGPTARVLELCRRDLLDEWIAGDRLVAGATSTSDQVDTVAETVRAAERALVSAGGLFAEV